MPAHAFLIESHLGEARRKPTIFQIAAEMRCAVRRVEQQTRLPSCVASQVLCNIWVQVNLSLRSFGFGRLKDQTEFSVGTGDRGAESLKFGPVESELDAEDLTFFQVGARDGKDLRRVLLDAEWFGSVTGAQRALGAGFEKAGGAGDGGEVDDQASVKSVAIHFRGDIFVAWLKPV